MGHDVRVAHDGQLGLESAIAETADVVVLDLMLPRLDGIAVCRELRRLAGPSSILMLTARDAVARRVRGLDAGADDYLVKPFALDELLARVRASGAGRAVGGGRSGWTTWSLIPTVAPSPAPVRRFS
jgi:DNA-binding response OmpR family regulator